MTKVEGRLGSVEVQIVELRSEMRAGFTSVLEVIDSSSRGTELMIDEVKTLIHATTAETARLIVDGDEQTRREMRVLHEDLIARIVVLAAARRPRRRRR